MRSYTEVTSEISEVTRKIETNQRFITESKGKIRFLETQKQQYLTGFESQCEALKQQQLAEAKRNVTLKYQKPYKAIDQSIKDINTLYTEKCNKFTMEYFLAKYSEETDQINKGTELAKEIEDLCCKVLGDDLAKNIISNLQNIKLKLNEQDIAEYLEMNKDISKELIQLKKYFGSDFTNTIYKFLAKIDPSILLNSKKEQDETQKRNIAIVYTSLCLLITGSLMYFFSGFLAILILSIGIFNIYKSLKIKNLIYSSKILQDNASEILEQFKQYAQEDSDEALRQLTKNKDISLAKLDKDKLNYKHKEEQELNHVIKTFVFDKSNLEHQRDKAIEVKNNEIDSITKSLQKTSEDLKDLNYILNNLNEERKEVIENLKDTCLSFNGTTTTYDSTYILDITDTSVLTWDFSKTSSLFVYTGEPDFTTTFIRLFVAQTMSKFKPGCCRIDIVDTVNLAMSYRVFEKTTDDPKDKARGCCAITIDSKGFENLQDALFMELQLRAKEIFSECSNIVEYNDIMEEVGGIRKDYLFYIFDHFPFKFFNEESTKQLLIQGSALGIYTLFFVTEEEMLQEKSIFTKVLPNIGKCYELGSDSISGITSNTLLDRLTAKN